MQDFGEVLVNTFAALAATSLCHFGVTLKEPPSRPKAEPAVVRRVQPARARPISSLRQRELPCPNDKQV